MTFIPGKYKLQFHETKNSAGERYRLELWVNATKNILGGWDWVDTDPLTSNINIWLRQWGKIRERFDSQDFTMAFGSMEIELADLNLWFTELFQDDRIIWDDTKVIMYKYSGTAWEKEFVGYVLDHSINTKLRKKSVFFDVGAMQHKINDSLTVVDGAVNNEPMGAGFSQSSLTDYFLVTDVIERLFKIISPDMTVIINQDWIFRDGNIGWTYSKGISDLYFQTKYLTQVETAGGWINNGMIVYGDVLKALAFDLGCVAGMLNAETAMFQSIYAPTNQVTIAESQVLDFESGHDFIMELQHLKLSADSTLYAEVGSYSPLPDASLEKKIYSDVYRFYGTDDIWHNMNAIYHADVGFYVKEVFQVAFWQKYFFRRKAQRRDFLTIKTSNIYIYNTIVYNGTNYRPYEIIKDYLKNKSEVKLLIM